MTDTDPETEKLYLRLFMEKTPEERFLMGLRMCEDARATVIASLPSSLSPIEQKIAILHRYYDADLPAKQLAQVEQALRT